MVTTSSYMRPIPKCSTASSRPPLQRSLSIDSHKPLTCRLSHGCQMDLKQAVQLEKQELCKMGHLPAEMPLPKTVEPEADEENEDETPPYWLYRQQRPVRRAASFSSGQTLCSPPVPIPQHEAPRRYSAAGGDDQQCEARLWDEFWNYKLSFESRESFEASTQSVRERASSDHVDGRHKLLKDKSEASMTCTEDTVTEDDEDVASIGPELGEDVHRYADVFEMDDL